MNRLRCFLGKRPLEVNGVKLYSPTIDEIDEIGELKYHINLTLATFDKESILKNLFGATDEEYEKVENFDDYDILTISTNIIKHMEEAISFFTKQEVSFNKETNSFLLSDGSEITKENYKNISEAINFLNGIEKKKEEPVNKSGKKYKKLKELKELRKKYNKNNNTLELKDILSILCSVNGNGINIFNVRKLTIYQVYERFERFNVYENHIRILRVWANGLLKENSKLPEWIVKTKL
ncbi:MAG: hypothetical protein GX053_15430 [Tissierella sp.]|nr:hypothetical protein [Tissierella sp.]